ncbi:5'-3' exoribonuclease 2 [Bienertia sinuspersici]
MFETNVCCDHNTSNFVESFNAVTKPYRDLPILSLLKAIETWTMKRIGQRFDKACDLEDNQVTDYAASILELRGDESRLCYAISCGGGEFEVKDGRVQFPIRLDRLVCACGVWQITGIPCKHAIRVIYNEKLEPKDFVSLYYKSIAYKATYSAHIHAMPDSSQWPSYDLPKIKPPPLKRGLGRPATVRKRGKDEPKKGKRNSTVKCSKCNHLGHNLRTCKGVPTAKQKKSAAASSSVQKERIKRRGKSAHVTEDNVQGKKGKKAKQSA